MSSCGPVGGRMRSSWSDSVVTAVHRLSHDLFVAQRFTRHVSPLTTTVYTHPSDQEIYEQMRGLSC
jgi:hypothetical protein